MNDYVVTVETEEGDTVEVNVTADNESDALVAGEEKVEGSIWLYAEEI